VIHRLLAAAIFAEVLMLLIVPRYVTVDGAAHVGGAALIRDELQGAGELHTRYVEFRMLPVPNLVAGLALSSVMLVADPATAEKLLQIAYVIVLPLALLYAVRSVGWDRDWLAFLAIPLTFTFAFQYGFYDFSFGVAAFLLAAGYVWRHRLSPSMREGLIFGVLVLLLYLIHLVPFLELLIFLAIVWLFGLIQAWRAGGYQAARTATRAALPLALGILPSALLAGIFLVATRTGAPAEYLNPLLQAIGIASLALGLVTTQPLEIAVAVGLALTLGTLLLAVLWGRIQREGSAAGQTLRDADALFAYATAALVIALVAPAAVESGGSYIPERLALFPVYGLALWLAAQDIPNRLAGLTVAVSLLAAVGLGVLRLPTTLSLSGAAVELESVAPCLATQSTLFQADLADLPTGPLRRTDPFGDEAGRVAAATRGHDLGNWEGTFPFFLYGNRLENDPFRWLLRNRDGLEVPPDVDIQAYRRRPYGTVDYVLVVGRRLATADTLASPGWASLRAELDREYRRVAASTSGLVEVWERRDPRLQRDGDARRDMAGRSACAA